MFLRGGHLRENAARLARWTARLPLA